MPGKKSRFWKNEKARAQLLSGVVVALMVLTTFTGLFLMSERASAATVLSEDFEDISEWTQQGTVNVVQGTPAHAGSYSAQVDAGLSDTAYMNATISVSNSLCTLSFYVYLDADSTIIAQGLVRIKDSAASSIWYVQVNESEQLRLSYKDGAASDVSYAYSTTVIPLQTWVKLTLVFDGTNVKLYSDTTEVLSVAYTNTGVTFDVLEVGSSSSTYNGGDYHIDDLTVTDTADVPSSNAPPTCSITSPTEGATVNGTVSITGTASDSDGTVQSVQVKIGSDAWVAATGTTSWSFTWDTTEYSDGSYTILARSYDGTDYSTNASITVTVDNTADISPSVALSGLTSGEITWSGAAGDVVWCNSSGTGDETVTATITGGSGTLDADVDQINITTSDLTGAAGTIADTYLVVYASVDNTNWYSFGSPSAHKVYLNTTTWTAADDPFPITGDDTIYLRFKLSVPSGTADGTFDASGWEVALVDVS